VKTGKTHACRIHAKRRAAERYGVAVNRAALREVTRQIQSGEAAFVEKQSLRLSCFLVVIDGRKMIAIYDRVRKTAVTFLPREDKRYGRLLAGPAA